MQKPWPESDLELVRAMLGGDEAAFERFFNVAYPAMFRFALARLDFDRDMAEEIAQSTVCKALRNLRNFRGEAALLTWMTRIVLNEAYGRLRQRRNMVDVDQIEASQASDRIVQFPSKFGNEDPAASAARAQIRQLVEHAIDDLPEPFRIVFVMREIEECTVEETAYSLDLRAETVKTRLYRARRLLRAALHDSLATTLTDAFPFLGPRCDRMTTAVLQRLASTFTAHGGDASARIDHAPPNT